MLCGLLLFYTGTNSDSQVLLLSWHPVHTTCDLHFSAAIWQWKVGLVSQQAPGSAPAAPFSHTPEHAGSKTSSCSGMEIRTKKCAPRTSMLVVCAKLSRQLVFPLAMLPSIQIWWKTESLWDPQWAEQWTVWQKCTLPIPACQLPTLQRDYFMGRHWGSIWMLSFSQTTTLPLPATPTASPCPASSFLPLPRSPGLPEGHLLLLTLPQRTSQTWLPT